MMEPTMEEYMTKTREDYGSGIARPKFDKDAKFELKDVTQDQLMLRVFPISLIGAESRWLRNEPADDDKKTIQEIANYSQKWHDGTSSGNKNSNISDGSTAIQAQLNNLGREIKKVNERSIKLSRASVPFHGRLKEYGYDEKEVLKGLKKLQVNSAKSATSLVKLAPTKLIIKLADKTMKRPKGIAENVLVRINKFVFPVDFIVLDMPEDIKIPLILGKPFLSTPHAKINVFKRKFSLRVGNDKIVFKSDSPTSKIIKKVYVLGLRERMKLDLKSRLMGEALILNRSQDLKFVDFLELNDLNEPLELRNHKNEDLDPEIKEGEVIDELMIDVVEIRHDNGIIKKIDEYPSFYDYDRKIHINCAYNLQFSCMIGYEHVNADFFLVLSINVMSNSFYNSIMKEKIKYKRKVVVGTFINVPILVGNFSIVTGFTVMANMGAYRDKDMGDVIFRKPFFRDECVEARRFDGFITIHIGNDNITYQMARSQPRFKHLFNEQCTKIQPLLKVSIRRIQLNGYDVSTRSTERNW
ncbi:homeodomain-like protein [Tanacetum coccineum]